MSSSVVFNGYDEIMIEINAELGVHVVNEALGTQQHSVQHWTRTSQNN